MSQTDQRIPVAILGPTGYTGLELLDLLAGHPGMRLGYLGSARTPGPRIDEEFPRLRNRLKGVNLACGPIDGEAIAKSGAKLAFLCLPHDAAMKHAPALLDRGIKVVDLSAAYRIRDSAVYEKHYGHPHVDRPRLDKAVYGLTEFGRDAIRRADLVANPGCYPTAAVVALLPLVRAGMIERGSIIINAASGASGAGRDAKPHLTLVEAGDNFSAYGIGEHRHQPEIDQALTMLGGSGGVSTLFVAHLLPVERGILETIYGAPARGGLTTEAVQGALRSAYEGERFIVVRDQAPTMRDVQHTNMVHVNGRVVGGRVVLVAAIDNLVKGASGQAIQNANLMLGLEEGSGLS